MFSRASALITLINSRPVSVTRRIVFRPNAEADLFALYRYIAEAAGLERAGAYIERIEAACMDLAIFPVRGARRDDLAPGLRTIGFERRVTIAFRVLEQVVEIVSIAYAGRDFESELREE
jgi:toxin ParE1/3/4